MKLRRAGAALALAAVVLLVIAELTTVFDVTVGSLDVVKRSATGGENHGYGLLIVAVVAAAMALLAVRGARAPAVALVALGAAALGIALAIDLPDTRASGQLPEALAYENARARAGPALGLELAGGALLVVAGALLVLAAGGSGVRARADGSGAGPGSAAGPGSGSRSSRRARAGADAGEQRH